MFWETIFFCVGLMAWFIGATIVVGRLQRHMEATEQKLQNLELSFLQEISEIKRQCKYIRDGIEKDSKSTNEKVKS